MLCSRAEHELVLNNDVLEIAGAMRPMRTRGRRGLSIGGLVLEPLSALRVTVLALVKHVVQVRPHPAHDFKDLQLDSPLTTFCLLLLGNILLRS